MQFFFILKCNSSAIKGERLFLEFLNHQQSISVQVWVFGVFFGNTAPQALHANAVFVYLQHCHWPTERSYRLRMFSNFMLYLFYASAGLEV